MNTIVPSAPVSQAIFPASGKMAMTSSVHRMYLAARLPPWIRPICEILGWSAVFTVTGLLMGLSALDFVCLSLLGGVAITFLICGILGPRGYHPFIGWDEVFHSILSDMKIPAELRDIRQKQHVLSGWEIESRIGRDDAFAMAALTHRIVLERRRGARKVELTGESSELVSRVLEGLRRSKPQEPERIALV